MKAKKPLLVLLLTLTLLILILLLPGASSAIVDTPDHHYAVSGEWSWWGDPDPDSFVIDRVVGITGEGELATANLFFHGWEWGAWTGTFVGSSFEPFVAVGHKNGRLWAIITINFTGSSAQRPNGLNNPYASTISMTHYAVKVVFTPGLPQTGWPK